MPFPLCTAANQRSNHVDHDTPRQRARQARDSPARDRSASAGGATTYERILDVKLTPKDDLPAVTIPIQIANPNGCTDGNACPSYEQALIIFKQRLGPSHPDTQIVRHYLAARF